MLFKATLFCPCVIPVVLHCQLNTEIMPCFTAAYILSLTCGLRQLNGPAQERTEWQSIISNLCRVELDKLLQTNDLIKRAIESTKSSRCSFSQNVGLLVFSTRPTSRVYGWFVCGRLQRIVCYSANNTHLTLYVVWQLVSNELPMLQVGSHQTLGYTTRRQTRDRRLLQTIALR